MVDSADSLCASCQVFTAPSLCLTRPDHCTSANLVHNAKRKSFSYKRWKFFQSGDEWRLAAILSGRAVRMGN
jgi:hypothetical protein